MNAKHSAATAEHYSPPFVVEPARTLMGRIDLDPASCAKANEIVKADRFFTREHDGLRQDWEAQTVFLNPPGGKTPRGESLAKLFWQKLAVAWAARRVKQAVFLGFSIEIAQTTQVDPVGPILLDFPFCVPRVRIPFLCATEHVPLRQTSLFGAEPLAPEGVEEGDQPTHANIVAYLPPVHHAYEFSDGSVGVEFDEASLRRFAELFAPVGRCTGLGRFRDFDHVKAYLSLVRAPEASASVSSPLSIPSTEKNP